LNLFKKLPYHKAKTNVLPNGTNDINKVKTSTRGIAVNIPNDQGINTNWVNSRQWIVLKI